MREIFKIIPSFPDYQVSNFGRVKTISRKIKYTHSVTKKDHYRVSSERFLKVQHNAYTGYKFHQLYLDSKMHNRTVHHLVANTFLKKVKGSDFINHKDGNKHNNTVENLEWCTNAYNHEHATSTGLLAKGEKVASSKLTDNTVYAIKYFLNKGVTHQELADAFQVSRPSITYIAQGKTWKHITTPLLKQN